MSGGTSDDAGDLWGTPDGGVLRTHGAGLCAGHHCALHSPSDHPMSGWPLQFTPARRWLAMRVCPHGVGHPDPDDLAWRRSRGHAGDDVHACDGCCRSADEVEATAADECPLCGVVAGRLPADVRYEDDQVMVIVPLNPVVDGHLLVLPRKHVTDLTTSYHLTGITARVAAMVARQVGDCNLITSRGRAATQSVFHLHWHLVPRSVDDGLALPWYSGRGGHVKRKRETGNEG